MKKSNKERFLIKHLDEEIPVTEQMIKTVSELSGKSVMEVEKAIKKSFNVSSSSSVNIEELIKIKAKELFK